MPLIFRDGYSRNRIPRSFKTTVNKSSSNPSSKENILPSWHFVFEPFYALIHALSAWNSRLYRLKLTRRVSTPWFRESVLPRRTQRAALFRSQKRSSLRSNSGSRFSGRNASGVHCATFLIPFLLSRKTRRYSGILQCGHLLVCVTKLDFLHCESPFRDEEKLDALAWRLGYEHVPPAAFRVSEV